MKHELFFATYCILLRYYIYIYIYIYILDKALLRVLYGKYSTQKYSTQRVLYFPYSTSEGSALSGIENCQLEIHTRHKKKLETHGVVLSSVE